MSPENIRHSLRNGFTVSNALSPVSRSSLATVAPERLISPELDASISGVRTTRLRRTQHPSSPKGFAGHGAVRRRHFRVHRNPPLVVTLANAPERDGIGENIALICISGKAKYFYFGA